MNIQRIVRALPKPLRRHKLVKALLTVADPVQLVRFNEGARLYADLRDGHPRTWMLNATYDPEFFEIARAFVPERGVLFDVGANVGFCSFGLLPTRPDAGYHLFEPNPHLAALLRRSASLDPRRAIAVNQAGVGERSGTLRLDTRNRDNDLGQGFLSTDAGCEVPVISLDEYVETHQIARVDFLKLDIEGYELFALRGARRSIARRVFPAIYFELKRPLLDRYNLRVANVIEEVQSLGYHLYFVRPEDFAAGVARPTEEIRGLPAAPVLAYPDEHWSDLLGLL